MSSDYIDYLEMNIQPEEGSQYWVAPFVQESFDKIIKTKRYDIAKEIKRHTTMHSNKMFHKLSSMFFQLFPTHSLSISWKGRNLRE